MGNEYLHMMGSLLVVFVIMALLFFLMKKFQVAKMSKNNDIKMTNALSFGAKQKIILVEVDHTYLLLGVTPNHIETLYVFNKRAVDAV